MQGEEGGRGRKNGKVGIKKETKRKKKVKD